MPTRSSARPRASSPDGHTVRRAIVYHGTAVTLLSIISLLMFLGVALALLASVARMERIERLLASHDEMLADLRMEDRMETSEPMKPLPTEPMAPVVTTTPSVPLSINSPSGKLTRGSLSPDGTKFAGYEETTKGKIGIAVEIIETGKIRYIVIFNPFTESTGTGTDLANVMSVRWVDNQTIEYDVLVTRGGTQTKETEQVRIFF